MRDKIHISFFYFSGTGNTEWAVKYLCQCLEAGGCSAEAISIEETLQVEEIIRKSDMIGIGFPIHSSFTPKIVESFINDMPNVSVMPLIGLSTAGYVAGDVLKYNLQPLIEKGYSPKIYTNIILGNNMHLPKLSPLRVTGDKSLQKKMLKAKVRLEDTAQRILLNKTKYDGNGVAGWLFGISQRAVADRMEAKVFTGFVADDTCTKCGWCVKNCPINAIKMTPKGVRFDGNCMICLRCYNGCPVEAIQFTEATKNHEKYKRYKGIQ